MKFQAEMKLTYRQLLALYTVSERLFRRGQMLLFRAKAALMRLGIRPAARNKMPIMR